MSPVGPIAVEIRSALSGAQPLTPASDEDPSTSSQAVPLQRRPWATWLERRRVYATNGARILLQCALDGHRMGSTIPPSETGSTSRLYLRVLACGPLAAVDLVRSGSVQRFPAEGRLDLSLEFDLPELADGEYLYVRAVQEDDGCAWSSPFFVQAGVEAEPLAEPQETTAPDDEPR